MVIELTRDVRRFLDAAAEHLASDPVRSTVVATSAARAARAAAEAGRAQPDHWWAIARDDHGAVVGAAMRTAPSAPYPPYVLEMPDHDARELARVLHARGEHLAAVTGALPAARVVLEETARLAGGRVEVGQHSRLHELGELRAARPVPGRLRAARPDEVDLCARWLAAFAEATGGGPWSPPPGEVEARIGDGRLWVWEDVTGAVVHLTGLNPPVHGVARVGPVWTPPEERGRGWASAAVGEVSRRLVADGARVCLVTDLANPTSNAIYAALGYRPVVDTASLVLVRPDRTT